MAMQGLKEVQVWDGRERHVCAVLVPRNTIRDVEGRISKLALVKEKQMKTFKISPGNVSL